MADIRKNYDSAHKEKGFRELSISKLKVIIFVIFSKKRTSCLLLKGSWWRIKTKEEIKLNH